jgi:hypothetical protein
MDCLDCAVARRVKEREAAERAEESARAMVSDGVEAKVRVALRACC